MWYQNAFKSAKIKAFYKSGELLSAYLCSRNLNNHLPPYTSLYLDGNQKEGSSLGVILPHVTKEENLPKTTCVLVACEKVDIPFFKFSEEDVDELRILDHATQKIRIRNSGLYRI